MHPNDVRANLAPPIRNGLRAEARTDTSVLDRQDSQWALLTSVASTSLLFRVGRRATEFLCRHRLMAYQPLPSHRFVAVMRTFTWPDVASTELWLTAYRGGATIFVDDLFAEESDETYTIPLDTRTHRHIALSPWSCQ